MIELDSCETIPEDFDNFKGKHDFVEKHAKTEILAEVLTKLMWSLKIKVKNNEFEIDLTDYDEEDEPNSYGW
jgi:hypothetical protein